MSDIGMIGSGDLIKLFGFLGVTLYPAEGVAAAKKALEEAFHEERHKVLFILETLAVSLKEEIREAEEKSSLTIVPLPDHRREISFLDDEIKRLSRTAIGMEV